MTYKRKRGIRLPRFKMPPPSKTHKDRKKDGVKYSCRKQVVEED